MNRPTKLVNISDFRSKSGRVLASTTTEYKLSAAKQADVRKRCDTTFVPPVEPLGEDVEVGAGAAAASGKEKASSREPIDRGLDGEEPSEPSDDEWEDEEREGELTTIPPDEVILTASFYNRHKNHEKRLATFDVLGSQPLTVLRDAFHCPTDFLHLDDDEPTVLNTLKRRTSPSYFFIEDVFYNDLRDPDAEDYSKKIIEWVHQDGRHKQRRLAAYTSKAMTDVTFGELCVRPGFAYLFVHQGCCQHVLYFDEIRSITPADPHNPSKYPRAILVTKARATATSRCQVCEYRIAAWVTLGDVRADCDPCVWCQDCFERFHFNADGTPAYEFEYHGYRLGD
ncbi:snRNA-activating protein of 50kDa MW C terminal-domain-containing protein [Fimicolochytrium jonesii]|uniref:snRNA-activating protein of 50kDa MW C terminal-domain-containing protein n=1 Tax=Fimicolochytrium jonesii TaxID=1396493 RepID=UPI0022FE6043|nr:snRNA-activating protein of 50kDa MW C terminal-domain-containing protein [Fimicolochytrium jonesii]KAI8815962.1 snRNA-activating protein of 50kDa MW C terminal-domain-containing protein [Fimicolochytrium jonesii]